MHFFKTLFGVVALAATAAAQSLAITSAPSNVEIGQTYTITYSSSDMSSPVTLTLMQGEASNLQTVMVLTSSATGGSWTWSPSPKIVSNTDYALEISQGSQVNYWGPIVINTALEPSSPAPAPAPYTTTMSPAPPPAPTYVPPPTNVTVPPPVNSTIPPPPPSTGAAGALTSSLTGLVAIFGAFVYFL